MSGEKSTEDNTPYVRFYHLLPKGQRLQFEQAPVDRQWMDETHMGYAYRCLPMTYASRHGWCVRAPYDVEVIWKGGMASTDLEIICGRFTEHGAVFADNGTGNGIVTFHINAIPRTPADWNLWIMPAPNLVIQGAAPLGGIIESDWMFSSPTMNWKITEVNKVVTFKKGDPVFFFVPVHKTELETFRIEHADVKDDPDMLSRWNEHLKWRLETEAAGQAVFGKKYLRGQNPDGSTPDWEHNHKTRLFLHTSDSNE